MRAVVQRVSRASVTVDGLVVGAIDHGFLVLLGVTHGDSEADARVVGQKIAGLRVFTDDIGKMNLSVQDVGGQVLLVSQFTLYGSAAKGRRPSFVAAAPPEQAAPLVDVVGAVIAEWGIGVECGSFGAHMDVDLVNDGPVTILLETVDGVLT